MREPNVRQRRRDRNIARRKIRRGAFGGEDNRPKRRGFPRPSNWAFSPVGMGQIMRLLRHIFLSRSFERDEAGATRQKSPPAPAEASIAGAIGAR